MEHTRTYAYTKRRRNGSRREILRMWRGFDEDELKLNILTSSTPADYLTKLFKHYKIDKHHEKEQLLYIWKHSIAPEIQAHAKPVNIVKGVLFVCVDNNAWLSEIVHFHRKTILTQLQAALGKQNIQKISFRLS